ncbi:MAG: UPF0175 family protein [Chloroflexi bacterium]|nr:UPF0175 family protein [Chloroflexota bacterium]
MDKLIIEVELPRDLLVALNVSADEAARKAQEWVVIELFREGEISSGKAAEILGVTKFQFIQLLDRRGIPYLDSSPEELAHELAVATSAIQRPKGG